MTLRSKPLVSVCIANYNGVGMISECIESALQQAGEFDLEILVHDDASTDSSAAFIAAKYPQVLLIVSKENVGFCAANNRMVARAGGDYVLLLNNDATLMEGALQTLLEVARDLGGPAILTVPQYDHESGTLVDRGCMLDPFYNPVPNLDGNRRDVAMVIGACLWIDRVLWEELGGFPDWFGSIAEDMYLCCRARLAGRPVQVSNTSGYRHRQGSSFGGNKPQGGRLNSTYQRRYLSERNKLRVMVLMSPGRRLAWLLPLHLVLSLAEALLMCLMSRRWDYLHRVHWPAWREAWLARGTLRKQRAELQGRRQVTPTVFLHAFTALPRKVALLWKYGVPRLE